MKKEEKTSEKQKKTSADKPRSPKEKKSLFQQAGALFNKPKSTSAEEKNSHKGSTKKHSKKTNFDVFGLLKDIRNKKEKKDVDESDETIAEELIEPERYPGELPDATYTEELNSGDGSTAIFYYFGARNNVERTMKDAILKNFERYDEDEWVIIDECRKNLEDCYYVSGKAEFTGRISRYDEDDTFVTFERIYFDYGDDVLYQGMEEHISMWDFTKQFKINNVKIGDAVMFEGEIYPFLMADGTVDFGIKHISFQKILTDSNIPTDDEILQEKRNQMTKDLMSGMYGKGAN